MHDIYIFKDLLLSAFTTCRGSSQETHFNQSKPIICITNFTSSAVNQLQVNTQYMYKYFKFKS